MSQETFLVISGVLLAFLTVGVLHFFPAWKARATGVAGELERLRGVALTTVENLPHVSSERRHDLMEDVDVFSAPVGGMPDVLRAMIRHLPSHYEHDIAGAALVLRVGREHGMDLSLTTDTLTASHIELYSVLEESSQQKPLGLEDLGRSNRSKNKEWVSSQKDICFAMDHLDDYPMLLPIIRDRGITDMREALEAAKVMDSSDAKPLSSGIL